MMEDMEVTYDRTKPRISRQCWPRAFQGQVANYPAQMLLMFKSSQKGSDPPLHFECFSRLFQPSSAFPRSFSPTVRSTNTQSKQSAQPHVNTNGTTDVSLPFFILFHYPRVGGEVQIQVCLLRLQLSLQLIQAPQVDTFCRRR